MKFFVISFILLSSYSFAGPQKILFCLGQEEAKIHKQKIKNHFYYLNRDLISSFLQLNDAVDIQDKILEVVCTVDNKKMPFPSLYLLKELIKKEDSIFKISLNKNNPEQRAMAKTSIDYARDKAIEIFFRFMAHIQSRSQTADCLTKKVPALKDLFEKMRYLQEDIGNKKILYSLKNVDQIFEKLLEIPYNDC